MKVSVIVPAFNVESYIEECLDSIVGQSLKEIEIIVVDDGSTDKTAEIIKRYEKNDNRVKYIYQENKKIGAARNTGWEVASGEYIYFIDSDDFIHPDWLKLLFQNAKKNDLNIICGGYINFLERSVSYNEIKDIKIDYNSYNLKIYEPEVFTKNNNIYEVMVWRYMYKKEFLDNLGFKFYEKIWHEDCEFSHKVIFSADRIGYIDAKLLYHRKWKGAFSEQEIGNDNLISSMVVVESLDKFYNESLDYRHRSDLSKMISTELIRPLNYRGYYKKNERNDDFDKRIKKLIFHFKNSSKLRHRILYCMLSINLPLTSKALYWRHSYHGRKKNKNGTYGDE